MSVKGGLNPFRTMQITSRIPEVFVKALQNQSCTSDKKCLKLSFGTEKLFYFIFEFNLQKMYQVPNFVKFLVVYYIFFKFSPFLLILCLNIFHVVLENVIFEFSDTKLYQVPIFVIFGRDPGDLSLFFTFIPFLLVLCQFCG